MTTYAAPAAPASVGATANAPVSVGASSSLSTSSHPAYVRGLARAAMPAMPALPAGTELVSLGEGARLFGAPAQMAVFRSAHDAAELLDYVATRHPEFNQLHIEPQRITLAAVMDTCIQSISVAQTGAGGSVGSMASLCDTPSPGRGDALRGRPDPGRRASMAEFALPSAELLLDVSFSDDDNEVSQQVWASPLSARHLDQAFRRRLAALGWQGEPGKDVNGPGGATSSAALAQHWRPGETLTYAITPTIAGGSSGSGLWLRRTRAAESDTSGDMGSAWPSIYTPSAGAKP
ncbi:hypothetical protein ACILG0_21025 [Pseudomonadota bacterium AL_CKDN230030165-1A_HGKHYDSX7]